jgi:hypothetical protein
MRFPSVGFLLAGVMAQGLVGVPAESQPLRFGRTAAEYFALHNSELLTTQYAD